MVSCTLPSLSAFCTVPEEDKGHQQDYHLAVCPRYNFVIHAVYYKRWSFDTLDSVYIGEYVDG